MKEFFAAIAAAAPEAIAREISAAARERRTADVNFPVYPGYFELGKGAHRIAYELAMPEMQAIADRYNAATEAEYEAYRLACEQRVAVPPAGK